MKKIGIVTQYGVHNHGAQLQLFALINFLKQNGYSARALQFEKDYRYYEEYFKDKGVEIVYFP